MVEHPGNTSAKVLRLAAEYEATLPTVYRRASSPRPGDVTLALAHLVGVLDARSEVVPATAASRAAVDEAVDWIRAVALGTGLAASVVEERIDELRAYMDAETAVCVAASPTEDAVWTANRLRSTDFRLAQACLEAMHGGRPPAGTRELRDLVMLLDEVADDLLSAPRDRVEGSFNTVLLFERIHGPERAHGRLTAQFAELTFTLLDRLNHATRAQAVDLLVHLRPALDRRWVVRACRYAPLPVLRVAAKYVATRPYRSDPEVPDAPGWRYRSASSRTGARIRPGC